MESLRNQLTSRKGTYALALHLEAPQRIKIGALGLHIIPAGNFIYIGSAFGSGGIRARLARHIEGNHAQHWHIDYLRKFSRPEGYWLAEQQRLECVWSTFLAKQPHASIILEGFGASDCSCATHLYQWTGPPFSVLIFPEACCFHAL